VVRRLLTVPVLLAILAATFDISSAPASADVSGQGSAQASAVKVRAGGHDKTVSFHRGRKGEVFLKVTVSARGVSWAERKNESAVVSASVDGRYATDIVITSSSAVQREFALGRLGKGRHTLRLHYATHRSRSDAGVATLRNFGFKTVRRSSPAYAAVHYAPVLYGRSLEVLGGRFQNNHTDVPLVAWHQVLPAKKPHHSVIEYSVVWSNEDGGTGTEGLMAKWGRTTDIEWIYRVEVNAKGKRVPGSGVFQAPNHGTKKFRGKYDGAHPLLQTCTENNNVCDKVKGPMRFALSMRGGLGAGQPREHVMDTHPWTYQVMAREMVRERKIETPPDPATVAVGDQRTYLYVAVTHDTDPAGAAGGVGLAVDVRLQGDPTTYSSDHMTLPILLTVNRNGPAATTVELPAGTAAADVAFIAVRRVPIGTDSGASLRVTHLKRAFFLGKNYLPRAAFARWHGSVTLTSGSPTAQVWSG
jgi:hypothetical protein